MVHCDCVDIFSNGSLGIIHTYATSYQTGHNHTGNFIVSESLPSATMVTFDETASSTSGLSHLASGFVGAGTVVLILLLGVLVYILIRCKTYKKTLMQNIKYAAKIVFI